MGRGALSSGAVAVIVVNVVVWLSVTIGLIAGSFAILTPHELGVRYNAVTKTLDNNQVYDSGRYYVGVGGYFIKFPRQLVYVEYVAPNALDVWSQDGQAVYLECSFYYKLREDSIQDVFYTFGSDFDSVIRAMASETVRDVATTYNTLDFFTNRSQIDDAIAAAVTTRLYNQGFANVTSFNLYGVDVPDAFEAAVIQKVITGQEVKTLEQLRESQLIRSTISVVRAQAASNITNINANATAIGLVTVNAANSSALTTLTNAKVAALSGVASDLGFTTASDLLTYLFTDILRGRAEAQVTAAFDISNIQARVTA